ncbi:MAG: hypothetical protein EPO22_05680 [Dehalococcoidia bacterium]|nr:MAG: hypothetical protein EPO22_05680 [Dehalococcoidia bacterium]
MSERARGRMGELERAIRDFALRRRRASQGETAQLESMSAPAFRSVVAERLRALERDVGEVRARVNGLLFVVAGAVVTQVVLRLFR